MMDFVEAREPIIYAGERRIPIVCGTWRQSIARSAHGNLRTIVLKSANLARTPKDSELVHVCAMEPGRFHPQRYVGSLLEGIDSIMPFGGVVMGYKTPCDAALTFVKIKIFGKQPPLSRQN